MQMFKKIIMYKNVNTPILGGIIGMFYGYYKGIIIYDNSCNKQKSPNFDNIILTNTILYSSIGIVLGYYPVIPIVITSTSLLLNNITSKLSNNNENLKDTLK